MPIPGRNFRRILIVRLGAMGDVIHGMPAVAALRGAFPEAQIGWVVEERWADLLYVKNTERVGALSKQRPLVDAVHTTNTRAWRQAPLSDETWREMIALRRELRSTRYDVVIDLQGALKSALAASASGAPVKFGFSAPRERMATMFYTEVVSTPATHVVDQNVELVSAVADAALVASSFDFPQDDVADQWCSHELGSRGVTDFVMMNPGAGWGAKCWPAERYADVARTLSKHGLRTVVNYGPGEEGMANLLEQRSGGEAVALKMGIPELIAVTRRAKLFIGGDTGPMHLAAAVGVPVVALFGPTDPRRNGPYGTRSVVLRSELSRTSHHRVAGPERGLQTITSEEVISAARRLLEAHA
jgi:heptosyltransferase-1